MDCDFDESLPSDSNFYMPARHGMGQPAGQSRSSYDVRNRENPFTAHSLSTLIQFSSLIVFQLHGH